MIASITQVSSCIKDIQLLSIPGSDQTIFSRLGPSAASAPSAPSGPPASANYLEVDLPIRHGSVAEVSLDDALGLAPRRRQPGFSRYRRWCNRTYGSHQAHRFESSDAFLILLFPNFGCFQIFWFFAVWAWVGLSNFAVSRYFGFSAGPSIQDPV